MYAHMGHRASDCKNAIYTLQVSYVEDNLMYSDKFMFACHKEVDHRVSIFY